MSKYVGVYDTSIGKLYSISDDDCLYELNFCNGKKVEGYKEQETKISKVLKEELNEYLEGNLKKFSIPLKINGTHFQQRVWEELQKIPYGETISYKQLAENVGNDKACRAVANANGKNKIAIIIPCHRVINSSGKLGGYTGGIEHKIALLKIEQI